MMIKAIGSVQHTDISQEQKQQTQTRFYHPQESKQKVKKDFDMLLQQEIQKINFSTVI